MAVTELALLCVLWSVFSVTECVRLRRSDECLEGLYNATPHLQCCRCPKGYYVESVCTSPQGRSTCVLCEPGTFVDHVNSDSKCELCKKCSSNENMEEETRCSASANTVCRCLDGHYCHKGDECVVCYPCSTCGVFGVKTSCNLTSDTQCNDAVPTTPSTKTIVGIFIIVLLICLSVVVVIALYLKKMLCFKSHETPDRSEEELLADVDLNEFLPRIAEVLGIKVVLNVVKHHGSLPQSKIDNIKEDYPSDANERAHQLLLAWYEKHGMSGAYRTLIQTLYDINMRVGADKVKSIIQDGQRTDRGLTTET